MNKNSTGSAEAPAIASAPKSKADPHTTTTPEDSRTPVSEENIDLPSDEEEEPIQVIRRTHGKQSTDSHVHAMRDQLAFDTLRQLGGNHGLIYVGFLNGEGILETSRGPWSKNVPIY